MFSNQSLDSNYKGLTLVLDGTTKDTGFLYLFIYLLLILLNMMAMMSREKKEIIGNLMLEVHVALQDTSIPFMGEGTEYFMLQKSQIMASLMGHLFNWRFILHTLNLCTMKSPIRHKIFRITFTLGI